MGCLRVIFTLYALILVLTACTSNNEWETHTPIKLNPINVIVNYSPTKDLLTLGVAPFESSDWPLSWRKRLTDMYENSLTKRKIFSTIKRISWNGENVKDLIFKARAVNCDNLLFGKIHKAAISGGREVQGLNLEIWIIDTNTLKTLYHVEQTAYSVPGPDRDWFWKTSVGAPAANINAIAKTLAEQFASSLEHFINKDQTK